MSPTTFTKPKYILTPVNAVNRAPTWKPADPEAPRCRQCCELQLAPVQSQIGPIVGALRAITIERVKPRPICSQLPDI